MTTSPHFQASRPGSYLAVAGAVMRRPRAFFADMPRDNIWNPLVFLLITQAGATLGGGLLGGVSPGPAAVALLQSLVQQLVVAGLLWASARLVMKSPLTLAQGLGIVAYGGFPWLLAFLAPNLPPPAGAILLALVVLVHLYLMLVGLQAAGGLWVPLAAACIIMAVVGLFLLVTLAGMIVLPGPQP